MMRIVRKLLWVLVVATVTAFFYQQDRALSRADKAVEEIRKQTPKKHSYVTPPQSMKDAS